MTLEGGPYLCTLPLLCSRGADSLEGELFMAVVPYVCTCFPGILNHPLAPVVRGEDLSNPSKNRREGDISSLIFQSIALIPKSGKDITHTRTHTYYRPISLMNAHTISPFNILANQIQYYIKSIRYHDQLGLIPGGQVGFNICKSTLYTIVTM